MTAESSDPIALEDRARSGARLSSPSAARNRAAIAEALSDLLPHRARVLEIASGTGEHALAAVTARPDLTWLPSEIDLQSRASVDAWALDAPGRIAPCEAFDMTQPGWADQLGSVDAMFCANMIHIAPWVAAEGLFAGAGRLLSPGRQLHLYGPFLDGADTAPSNLEFDASLKRRNPDWGVRAVDALDGLAADAGLARVARRAMPANNLILSFERSAS